MPQFCSRLHPIFDAKNGTCYVHIHILKPPLPPKAKMTQDPDKNSELKLPFIGFVKSGFSRPKGTPVQPCFSSPSTTGEIELLPQYEPGLKDLGQFSHIAVFYYFHKVEETKLVVTPFLDTTEHGIFATRSPARPSRLGFSVLPLLGIEGRTLRVSNLDILNETPVIDLKPFVPEFDVPAGAVDVGWYANRLERGTKVDDGRFTKR